MYYRRQPGNQGPDVSITSLLTFPALSAGVSSGCSAQECRSFVPTQTAVRTKYQQIHRQLLLKHELFDYNIHTNAGMSMVYSIIPPRRVLITRATLPCRADCLNRRLPLHITHYDGLERKRFQNILI